MAERITTDTPKIGVDVADVQKSTDVKRRSGHRLGAQIFATDGQSYVYAQAGATIAANTSVCNINTTTFIVTATGGNYKSPPVAMANGDRGWFAKASV